MFRFKLRNKFLKDKINETIAKYRTQRNVCVHWFQMGKRNYYHDFDLSDVKDSRKCWKAIKLPFGNKSKVKNKITLDNDSRPKNG